MTARRPRMGAVVRLESGPRLPAGAGKVTNTPIPVQSGRWRPNSGFRGQRGLRVTMAAERGYTPTKYLRVPFRFQCPPVDRFGRPWEHGVETYDTIGGDERARDGGQRLERITLDTMFADELFDWTVWTGAFDPQKLLEELKAIEKAGVPFRLTIAQPALWGAKPLVNFIGQMTRIEPEERGGSVGTEYTQVEFMELGVKRKGRRPVGDGSTKRRRYRLRKGDTLHSIARSQYDSGSVRLWRDIARENGIKGVGPASAPQLAAWAKRHHKDYLIIPASKVMAKVEYESGPLLTGGGTGVIDSLA